MTLDAPDHDSRDFDQLINEARQRIARWVPDWTDHNASDPGIALFELFTWLTETLLYEFNRIPDLNYVKFLDLLGLQQTPATAARAELTFTADSTAPRPVVVPKLTQAAAEGADGATVVFETDREITLVPYPLDILMVDDGAALLPVTAPFRPFGWTPQAGCALHLGFAPPDDDGSRPGTFPDEIDLYVAVPAAAENGGAQRADRLAALPVSPVQLAWEYLPDTGRSWRPLQLFDDGAVGFTRTGYMQIAGPKWIMPATLPDDEDTPPRYWLRCRLAARQYPAGREPVLEAVAPNTVSATNLVTVRDELLGVSEGHPGETFTTAQTPVEAGSVQIDVRPDTDTTHWTEHADLLSADRDKSWYTVDPVPGRITFGDGVHGRIPPVNSEVVATAYRYGGGPGGNVGRAAVSNLVTPPLGVESVTNRWPAAGGSAKQDLEELKREAPDLLRRQGRAVTADDYASIARETGGVADAKALPQAHPDHPGVDVPGAVTVVVVAEGEKPLPGPELLAAVGRNLEEQRLLTTELYVRAPELRTVVVTAGLGIAPGAAPGPVIRAARDALKTFFAPVRPDAKGRLRAGFGQAFAPTELYRVLMTPDGVQSVNSLTLSVDGRPHDDVTTPVSLAPWQILAGGEAALSAETSDNSGTAS
jgi:predicted phage baseplate assembly protein